MVVMVCSGMLTPYPSACDVPSSAGCLWRSLKCGVAPGSRISGSILGLIGLPCIVNHLSFSTEMCWKIAACYDWSSQYSNKGLQGTWNRDRVTEHVVLLLCLLIRQVSISCASTNVSARRRTETLQSRKDHKCPYVSDLKHISSKRSLAVLHCLIECQTNFWDRPPTNVNQSSIHTSKTVSIFQIYEQGTCLSRTARSISGSLVALKSASIRTNLLA